jgi:hypothetical protein
LGRWRSRVLVGLGRGRCVVLILVLEGEGTEGWKGEITDVVIRKNFKATETERSKME